MLAAQRECCRRSGPRCRRGSGRWQPLLSAISGSRGGTTPFKGAAWRFSFGCCCRCWAGRRCRPRIWHYRWTSGQGGAHWSGEACAWCEPRACVSVHGAWHDRAGSGGRCSRPTSWSGQQASRSQIASCEAASNWCRCCRHDQRCCWRRQQGYVYAAKWWARRRQWQCGASSR